MSAFPISTSPSPRTKISADSGKRTAITMGGGLRGRNSFSRTYFNISRVDQDMTQSDVTAIQAHFDATPNDDHTMTIDGVAYNFNYLARPDVAEYYGEYRTVVTQARGWL